MKALVRGSAAWLCTGAGAFAGLCGAYLLYAAALRPWGDFPLNDDWVYARDALRSLECGTLSFTGFETAWGLPQIAWGALLAQLFPFSHGMLRATGLLAALFCAAAIHVQLLRKRAAPLHAACGAGLFLFFTPVVATSFTFMLDVPFLALWLWTLVVYEIAWERRSRSLGALGAALSVLCLLQRQVGVFAVLAAGAWFAWQALGTSATGRRPLPPAARWFAALLTLSNLAALGVFALVNRWWATLPHSVPTGPPDHVDVARALRFAAMSLVYAGVLAVALPALRPRGSALALPSDRTERGLAVAAAAGLALCFWVLTWRERSLLPYFGNVLSCFGYFGEGEVLAGQRERVVSRGAQLVVTALGFLGAFRLVRALIGTLVRRARARAAAAPAPPLLLLATLLYTLGMAALPATMFDRYLLPLFALVPILLLEPRADAGRRAPRTAGLCAVVLAWALLSFPFQWDYLRWNEARWQAGRAAVAQGIPAAAVEAGYEWDGWHRALRPAALPRGPATPYGWYTGLFAGPPPRALVSFSDRTDLETLGRFSYRSLLRFGGVRALYLEKL
jgi:hypothetical protein